MLRSFFDIRTVLFEVGGYQVSWLEFTGTVLNLWSVWLVGRSSILTWPVGNVAVALFAVLFFQVRLYSDLLEQLYFLVTGFYGWWVWARSRRDRGGQGRGAEVGRNTLRRNVLCLLVVAAGTALLGRAMGRIHLDLPAWFPEAASFPYLDALTTVMSFVAMILMAHRRIECWLLWIAVDGIGVWLYHAKGTLLLALLYLLFLGLAVKGLLNWRRLLPRGEAA